MTTLVDVKFFFLLYDVGVETHETQKHTKKAQKNTKKLRKDGFIMKKFVALGAALLVLLFSCLPTVEAVNENAGIQVCDDLEPDLDMYN